MYSNKANDQQSILKLKWKRRTSGERKGKKLKISKKNGLMFKIYKSSVKLIKNLTL